MKKILALGMVFVSVNSFASAGSCTLAEEYTCVEYTGAVWSQNPESIMQSCAAENGTFSTGSCSTEGNIGGCLMYEDQPVEHIINFYSPVEVADAQTACAAAGGLWK